MVVLEGMLFAIYLAIKLKVVVPENKMALLEDSQL